MTDNPPKLVVFAGPNGSGKSTITNDFMESNDFPPLYINPDEIALNLNEENPKRKAYQAAIIAEEQRFTAISQKESFAFETVMSHPSKLKLLEQAKESGYQVELVFVATSDPEVNVDRVKQRFSEGGHDVPEDKVRSRYHRSINLLPAATEIADLTYIFDNTQSAQIEARIEDNSITFQAQDSPTWVQSTLNKLESPAADRESIASNSNFIVNTANIDTGKYVGEISQITNNYIVQETGSSLTIHDKSIAKGDFEVGQDVRIAYKDGNVAASIQPTAENQQWAQGIYDTASYIFQAKDRDGQTEMPSRGIKVAQGNQYSVEFNNNSKTLTVLSNGDNRTVASFDLEEQSVIASNPSPTDKQQWTGIVSQTQTNIQQSQAPNTKPEFND